MVVNVLHLVQLLASFFLTRLVEKKLKFVFPKIHTQFQTKPAHTYLASPWGCMRSTWHAFEGLNEVNRQLLLKLPKVQSLAFEKDEFLPLSRQKCR